MHLSYGCLVLLINLRHIPMNILWITNALLPEATAKICGTTELKGTGGWVPSLAKELCQHNDIHLYIAALSPLVKKITIVHGERITHFAIPSVGDTTYQECYEEAYRKIFQEIQPDVVHIHGTEYPHSLAAVNGCGADKVCISIQGLVGPYLPYYHDGLSYMDIIGSLTPAGILRNGIINGYRDFKQRSKYERQAIAKVHHIIGRTSWDRAHTWAINPEAQYHYGGEILRSDFYRDPKWHYNDCAPHSIFLSQAGIPLKGLHQVLRAMPLVMRHFPDTTIRIAGADITRRNGGWKERMKLSDYGNIIRKMIKKFNLKDCVTFTGNLNAEEMKREYLRSNVFVCPSSIENSPNSLAEAQILGVPVLASQVGGIPDMMQGDEEHLYRFEEIEMLAHKIVQLFEKQDEIDTEPMRQVALKRHNPEKIIEELIDTYKAVMDKH